MRRNEWNRVIRTCKARAAERQLDGAAQAAGTTIDKCNPVATVLGQMILGITYDEHVGQQQNAHGPEGA